MPNKCFTFFKRQDQLGHGVAFNFRGESGYGTVIGGVLSFCTTIFFTVFISIQLYAFLFAPDYNQDISVTYQSRYDREAYDIPLDFFLPTFLLVDNIFGDVEPQVFNSKENWYPIFVQHKLGEPDKYIVAVNCKELVESWTDLEPGERETIISELADPDNMFCPNIDSFQVMGGADALENFVLMIIPTQKAWETEGLIDRAGIYTAEISRYFNPEEYQQNGYQNAITLNEDVQLFNADSYIQLVKQISMENVGFFDFKWLDTAAITLFDFGSHFTNYKVEKTQVKDSSNASATYPVFWLQYEQSRVINEVSWAVQSLDLVLGLVGGLSAIIWAVLAIVLGGYESFRYENSLIGSVYPTSPQEFNSDGGVYSHESEQKAKSAMMRTVAERGKYWYSYDEYLLITFLKTFCCCFCKNKQWYQEKLMRLERHEAASAKLADEIDIVKLLYMQRVGQFIAKLILRKHQRALVTSFKKYQIDDLGQAAKTKMDGSPSLLEPTIQKDGMLSDFDAFAGKELLTEDQLKLLKEISDKFSTEDSAADLSILYEVTGYQAESHNFEYWENYQDFEELGDTNLIRDDKNEQLIALTSRNQGKKKITFEDVDT